MYFLELGGSNGRVKIVYELIWDIEEVLELLFICNF